MQSEYLPGTTVIVLAVNTVVTGSSTPDIEGKAEVVAGNFIIGKVTAEGRTSAIVVGLIGKAERE